MEYIKPRNPEEDVILDDTKSYVRLTRASYCMIGLLFMCG